MSTRPEVRADPATAADATVSFVQAFEAWVRRASVANAGESVPRLRLLNELHCNGPRKMADLAGTLGVTPRTVTTLVDALEAEQLVRRSSHPTDRRVTMVEITGGAATVERQFAAFQGAVADLFGGLSEADRRAFLEVLAVLESKIRRPERGPAASDLEPIE